MNVTEKLREVQAKLKAPKSQFNAFGKYKYRSLEDILEAVKPILSEIGAFITLTDEIVCIGNGTLPVTYTITENVKGKDIKRTELLGGDRYYVKTIARFSDGDKEILVSAYAREPLNRKGMDESQITAAASSYARKIALNGLLAIDDTKDADATNKHQNGEDEKPKPETDVTAIVEQEYFNFTTEWKDECPEGCEYNMQAFKDQLRVIFKKQSQAKREDFDWTDKKAVSELVKKIKPDKIIKKLQKDNG